MVRGEGRTVRYPRQYKLTRFKYLAKMAQCSIIARMIERRIHKELVASIDSNHAVALLGPRQAGKTTLALEIAHTRPSLYLDLECLSDRLNLTYPEGYHDVHDVT